MKFRLISTTIMFTSLLITGRAEALDPEAMIKKEGYEKKTLGSDGKTYFFVLGKFEHLPRIQQLEKEVAKLPKDHRLFSMCDFLRAGAKAKLIEKDGLSYDVAVTDYGYDGPAIACVLKFMLDGKIGTQISYSKKGQDGMYMVFFKTRAQ